MNLELIEENGKISLYVPSNKPLKEIYNLISKLQSSEIDVVRVDRLSLEQMKLIWVLCREYGELIGYTPTEMRELLENEFCSKREIEYFSISPFKRDACSLDTATAFIQFIIEHSINQDYNLLIHEGKGVNQRIKHVREVVPDIRKYVLMCLLKKRCAVCGKIHDIDLHHWDSVNTIGGYEHDDGLQTRFISLCREHHTLFHNVGEKIFSEKWHLEGIWLSVNIVKELKKVYPNHFKAFKEENYGGNNG